MSAGSDSTTIPFNEPEHLYAALDGVAGTMGSVYTLKFDTPVPVDQMRAVLRELVSALPRFRGIVERGAWRSHMRILPDNAITDQLFDGAFQVASHVDAADPQALERFSQQVLNECLPLERGLACHFRYIPHPQTPVLIVVMHHLLFDGRSAVFVVSTIARRLNEAGPIAPVPLEAVPMMGAMRPLHWWQWPSAILGELRYRGDEKRRYAGASIQMVNHQDQPYMSNYALRYFTAPCSGAQLRSVGRKLGLTSNGVMLLALAEAFLSYAPGDPKAAAVIRQAVDLRAYQPKDKGYGPMLGNQVGSYLVSLIGPQSLVERAALVKDQLRSGIERYDRRQMGFGLWLANLPSYLGPHLTAYALTKVQRQLKMPSISCYATNIGNLTTELNQGESRIKVIDFMGYGPSGSLMHGITEINDRVNMPLVWQRCEATYDEIDDYLARLSQAFLKVIEEGSQLERRRPRPKGEAEAA